MIAIDTNVLLRYLLRDDEAQAERAHRLINRESRVLITDVVLVEAIWTLLGRRYRVGKVDLIAVVQKLLREPNLRFEDGEVVWQALQAYSDAEADFADALIVCKAVKVAALDDGLDAVYTFDSAALGLPSTAALPELQPQHRDGAVPP